MFLRELVVANLRRCVAAVCPEPTDGRTEDGWLCVRVCVSECVERPTGGS